MDSLKGGSSGSPSRASRTVQAFEVFRDTPQGDSLPDSGRSADTETHGIPAELTSHSTHPPVVNSPSQQTGPDGAHDRTDDALASPVKRHVRFSTRGTSDTTRGGVLVANSLKLNLSPRDASGKHIRIVMNTKPATRQKRGLPQEDQDKDQYPRKSLKSETSTAQSSKDSTGETDSKYEPHDEAEAVKESSVSSALVLVSHPLEEIDIDDAANGESCSTTVPEPSTGASTKPAEELAQNTYAAFNGGDPTTPRSPAIYNFNSTIRMLNPFKAVGNLFGRSATTHSPSRRQHETLSSNEIAKQVDDHLQRFEDRMFERLLAFQTANQAADTTEIRPGRTTTAALLSSPIALASENVSPPHSTGLVMSPLQGLNEYIPPDARSSPLLPMSEFKKITLHPGDAALMVDDQQNTLRGSFAAFLKSPTIGKSKREAAPRTTSNRKASFALSNLFSSPTARADGGETQNSGPTAGSQIPGNEYLENDVLLQDRKDILEGIASSPIRGKGNTGIAVTENNHEQPRLRNKASQHLKKMASRMNLRNRKSTVNDTMPPDNDEYRAMKKKNKNEILKDYMALQQEKQDLEKQLAMRAEHAKKDDDTIQAENTEKVSPSKQTQDNRTTNLLPVLLESKIPDLRAGRKRSSSPDSRMTEQNRAKRRTLVAPPADLPMSLPLSPLDSENTANTCQPIPEHIDSALQLYDKASDEGNEGADQAKPDDADANATVGKVPPVPAVPSKYRSKVPQPKTAVGLTRKRKATEENWDGWDAEVF